MENIIEFKNVSKKYRLGAVGIGSLNHDLQSLMAKIMGKEDPNLPIGKRIKKGDFLALDNISFSVKKGETVGIIGKNGAGKSTLLKLLSRVTAPSEGEIHLGGRVASMLEVGTGFHPELTGRENIYLNGSILGMTRAEVDSKMESIIEFSECGKFIDTPIKRYSSGMYVKLAFSVAAHLNSEILLMDEVLAVGDVHFQHKCIEKMRETVSEEDRTILYVSHNMNTVRRLCERCIVLDEGKIIFDGDTEEAIKVYMRSSDISLSSIHNFEQAKREKGLGVRAKINELCFSDKEKAQFDFEEEIKLKLNYLCKEDTCGLKLRFTVSNLEGAPIGSAVSKELENLQGEHTAELKLTLSGLMPDKYLLTLSFIALTEDNSTYLIDKVDNAGIIEIISNGSIPIWSKKRSGYVIFNK